MIEPIARAFSSNQPKRAQRMSSDANSNRDYKNRKLLQLARLYRLRDAPTYLGMDINRFNEEVRPFLTEIPIGEQGIAFDRLELDAWADDHKSRSGRPPKKEALWQERHQGSIKETGSGTSISKSKDMADFARLRESVNSNRRSAT
jgi:hypothetical protein